MLAAQDDGRGARWLRRLFEIYGCWVWFTCLKGLLLTIKRMTVANEMLSLHGSLQEGNRGGEDEACVV